VRVVKDIYGRAGIIDINTINNGSKRRYCED